ncbi:H-2 class II histocompatibility antigen, A-Q alpha chain-like [Micropterus salmoides]|uniref:H-2 class II histocompatibility antigen, A-Q alpha chain-like n=1 Tax=Micropterus salmoides TaxID=27706 RepID=UPI0018EB45CA|nr:H-2 class II histocompatibility antigen, A-Q alpha chain-like [Micropterus salmoides]XP_045927012.1 H-2 class II histocompatibility antigen, A-Q alpha chain-like [Micropterus dolomieu]
MFGFEMTLSVIVLSIFTGAVCTSATTPSHDFHYIYGCYESIDVRVDVVIDEEVAGYADFSNKEIMWVMPHLPQYVSDLKKRGYEIAKDSITHCHSVLGKAKKADPDAPIRQEAPEISIYTRYEAEDGVINTLFCLANHFHPPTINFTWSRNGVEITEGVSNLRYRHNSDGTFHRISTLSFTPGEEDVYSCSVEHQALQQPLTRSWVPMERKSSVSPAAWFFGASLVLCLMGIGTGAFFLTRRSN